jgi:hypothetical protein
MHVTWGGGYNYNGHGGEKLIVSKETYYSVKRDLLVLTAMAARS